MYRKSELKESVISAVPDAAKLYNHLIHNES